MGGDPTVPPMSRPVLRVELDGEVVHTDTVVKGWLPRRGDLDDQVPNDAPAQVRDMLGTMKMPAIFEPALLVGVLPDGGIVHSDSSAYALKVTPPDARGIARILRRPLRPEPLTPSIERDYDNAPPPPGRDSAERRRVSGMLEFRQRGDGNRPQGTTNVEIEESYYHEIPVLRSLVTTWDGRIWVQRRGEGAGKRRADRCLDRPEGSTSAPIPPARPSCLMPSARTDWQHSSSLTNSTWPVWSYGGCQPRFGEPRAYRGVSTLRRTPEDLRGRLRNRRTGSLEAFQGLLVRRDGETVYQMNLAAGN